MQDLRYLNQEKPIEFYVSTMQEKDLWRMPWHWHPVLQITMVEEGSLIFYVGDNQFQLEAGDGMVVNINQMHRYDAGESGLAKVIQVLFLPEFIATPESRPFHNYVEPFLQNESLPCLVLYHTVDWHQEILQLFHRGFSVELNGEKEPCHEMKVHEYFSAMWRRIFANLGGFSEKEVSKSKLVSQVRVKQMLAYIDKNYKEKITLDDIAGAACISRREALRCFQENLYKTPFAYLMEFRIGKAKNALVLEDGPVVNIALSCGFESASYFNRVFRRYTGMTPREYRKNVDYPIVNGLTEDEAE
jgi:AraC-like DNA-binding protein